MIDTFDNPKYNHTRLKVVPFVSFDFCKSSNLTRLIHFRFDQDFSWRLCDLSKLPFSRIVTWQLIGLNDVGSKVTMNSWQKLLRRTVSMKSVMQWFWHWCSTYVYRELKLFALNFRITLENFRKISSNNGSRKIKN